MDGGRDAGEDAGPRGPWRSALFGEGWTPADTDAQGRFLHDFSYAGYHAGEGALGQDVSADRFDVAALGADPSGAADSTAAIQAAIDAASIGGGVVIVPAGLYRVEGRLAVTASRVVLRGAGSSESQLYFPNVAGMSYQSHVRIGGTVTSDLELGLTADARARDASVEVGDASDLAIGDDIEIGFVITPQFVEAHAMTGTWTVFNGTWQSFARRTVLAIDGGRITLDVPLRQDALVRDSASVRRVRGLLREVGVEGLGLADAVSPDVAWAEDQVHVLELSGVADAWIEDVASFPSPAAPAEGEGAGDHLASGGIVIRASRRVTIADTHLARAQHRGSGGNGYLFEIRTSNEILTRDSTGRAGRHNFIQNWGFGTSGCVWLRVRSSEGRMLSSRGGGSVRGSSEFHHSLATANLIDDSVLDDGWLAFNRMRESSGAGHSASENVLWRSTGAGVIRSFQWGWGYVIGTSPELTVYTDGIPWEQADTEPIDLVEGLGRAEQLEPRSLYEAQLLLRRAR